MRVQLILGVVLVFVTACSHSLCPTYDGTKGYSASDSYSRKHKVTKKKVPQYKKIKQAEVD